jgi:hypothetical protein
MLPGAGDTQVIWMLVVPKIIAVAGAVRMFGAVKTAPLPGLE